MLIEKNTGREINVNELERNLAEAITKPRDERVVRPSQFKISDIDPQGILNGILVYSDEDIEAKVEACGGRILWGSVKYAEGKSAGHDAVFKSITPTQKELVHQSPIFGRGGLNYANMFIQNGVIGNPEYEIYGRLKRVKGIPTYLKEEGTDASDYLGGFTEVTVNNGGNATDAFACLQFNISVPELLKSRAIFFDPECTYTPKEYKKLYLVFGGIPLRAVTTTKIKIIN